MKVFVLNKGTSLHPRSIASNSRRLGVQAPENSQSYNKYSYAFNNPLKYTDPTGYVTAEVALSLLLSSEDGGTWNSGDANVTYFSEEEATEFAKDNLEQLTEGGSGEIQRSIVTIYNKNGRAVYYDKNSGEVWNPETLSFKPGADLFPGQMFYDSEGNFANVFLPGEVEIVGESGGGGVQVQEAAVFAVPLLYELAALTESYLLYQFYTSRGNPKPVINVYPRDGKPPYWRNPGGLLIQFATTVIVTAVILDRISPKTQNVNKNPLDFNNKYNPSDMILPISDPAYWNSLTDRQKIGYMDNVLNNN